MKNGTLCAEGLCKSAAFAFCIGIMMLVLIVILPLFIKMMTSIGELYQERVKKSDEEQMPDENKDSESFGIIC